MALESSGRIILRSFPSGCHDTMLGTVNEFTMFNELLNDSAQFGKTILGNVEFSSDYPGLDGLIISGLDVLKNLLLQVCSVHEAAVSFRWN
jgi:hypothetical protein